METKDSEFFQVTNGCFKEVNRLLKEADPHVTSVAKKSTDFSGDVVMIDLKPTNSSDAVVIPRRFGISADGASSTLRFFHLLELFDGQSEQSQVSASSNIPVVDFKFCSLLRSQGLFFDASLLSDDMFPSPVILSSGHIQVVGLQDTVGA